MRVTIFDYGAGNLHSLAKALEQPGVEPGDRGEPVRGASRPTCSCCRASARSPAPPSDCSPARDAMRARIAGGLADARHLPRHAAPVRVERRGPGRRARASSPGRVTRLRATASADRLELDRGRSGSRVVSRRAAAVGRTTRTASPAGPRTSRRDRVEHARDRPLSRRRAPRVDRSARSSTRRRARRRRAVASRVSRRGAPDDRDSGGRPARRGLRAARRRLVRATSAFASTTRSPSRAGGRRSASRACTSSTSTRRPAPGTATTRSSRRSSARVSPTVQVGGGVRSTDARDQALLDAGARASIVGTRASRTATGWPTSRVGRIPGVSSSPPTCASGAS